MRAPSISQKAISMFVTFALVMNMNSPVTVALAAEQEAEQVVATEVAAPEEAAPVEEVAPAPEPEPVAQPEPEAPVVEEPAASATDDEQSAAPSEPAAESPAEAAEPTSEPEGAPVAEAEPTEAQAEDEPSEDEPSYPAATLTATAGGVTVTVSAPEGALPEGAKLVVRDATSQVSVGQMESVTGSSVSGIRAVDISFRDASGTEVEPLREVAVSLKSSFISQAAQESGEDPTIVHIADNGAASVVEQSSAAASNEVKFESSDFSIYVIVGKEGEDAKVFQRTYHFLEELGADGMAGAYTFYDKAGNLVSTQVLKDGDVLAEVGTPSADSKHFLGWYIVTPKGDGSYAYTSDQLSFGTVSLMSLTTDDDIYVAPKFEASYEVTFHESGEPGSDGVIQTKKVSYESGNAEANCVLVSDVIAPQLDPTHIFYGWTDGTNEYPVYGDDGQVQPTYVDVEGDLDLYPMYNEAYWLHFAAGPTGSGATYVPSRFVKADESLIQLPITERKGYTFAGWYTEEDGGTQVTDAEGTVLAADGLTLVDNTTLFAHWTPGDQSTYTVIVWAQKVTDAVDTPDADKSYDYVAEYSGQRTGTTGASVAPTSDDTSHTMTGFHYARTKQNSETIKADGSTVINVYYDRDVITINFYYRSGHVAPEGSVINGAYKKYTENSIADQYGKLSDGSYIPLTKTYNSSNGTYTYRYTLDGSTYTYTGTRYVIEKDSKYPTKYTISGLYGQKIDKWPGIWGWEYTRDDNSTTSYRFLESFQAVNMDLYDNGNSSDAVLYHLMQLPDGTWSNTNKDAYYAVDVVLGNGSWTFSETFTGFTLQSYSNESEGFSPNGGSQAVVQGEHIDNGRTDPFYIYYTRDQHSITYMDGAVELRKIDDVYYQTPLESYDFSLEDVGLTEREHYKFTGWYYDAECNAPFDPSDTMPAGDVVLFAGWEPDWYKITVDPAGGVIDGGNATYFWKQSGDTIDAYTISRAYIEDPNGEYKYVYNDGSDDLDGTSEVKRTATYELAEDGYAGTRYRLAEGADQTYSLVGWYVVDENGNTTSTPYDFSSPIQGDLTIRAVWRLSGAYTVNFSGTATVGETKVTGTVSESLSGKEYADAAQVVLPSAPSGITEGYVFDGWEVVDASGNSLNNNGGSYLQPGSALTLNASSWADAEKIIHIQAHYTSVEDSDAPVAVTSVIFDANGGMLGSAPAIKNDQVDTDVAPSVDGNVATYSGLPLNQRISLSGISESVSLAGHKLVGWNTDQSAANEGNAQFAPNATVGADNLTTTGNTLYAVWEESYIVTAEVSGSDTQKYNGTDQTFDDYTVTYFVDGIKQDEKPEGVDFVADESFSGATGKNVGTYEATITGILTSTNDNYTIAADYTVSGTITLEITKRNVTLTSATASKVYNGVALTDDTITVGGDGWAADEGATYNVLGTLTIVGEVENTFTYKLNEGVSADNYNITTKNGTLTVTGRNGSGDDAKYEITVQGKSGTVVYNGEEQELSGLVIDTFSFNGQTFKVEGLTASATGKNAGTYANTVSGTPIVRDAAGNNVTDQFVVHTQNGELTISQRTVYLQSASPSKDYDGDPIDNGEITVSGQGFVSGEGATYKFTASLVAPGQVSNTFEYTLSANTSKDNYDIQPSYGQLTIRNLDSDHLIAISIKANSGTVLYDGEAHSTSGLESDTFTRNGHTYTISGINVSASGTDAGTYKVQSAVADGATPGIIDEYGNNVIGQFNLTFEGALTINKRNVTLTSGSASKHYNGTALTNDKITVSGDGFAVGEGASYDVSGTQTLVGKTSNTFTYTLNESTEANNYIINKSEGTLEIVSRDKGENAPGLYTINVYSNGITEPITYDGDEHSVTGFENESLEFTFDNKTYTVSGLTTTGASGKDVGTYTNEITLVEGYEKPVVTDADGNDVSSQFTINTYNGTFTIKKADASAYENDVSVEIEGWKYDGTSAVENHGLTATSNISEHKGVAPRYTWYSVRTEQGSEGGEPTETETKLTSAPVNAGTYIVEATWEETKNYPEITNRTRFTVSRQHIVVTSDDAKKIYDGTPLMNSSYTITGKFIGSDGIDITATGSRILPGDDSNTFDIAYKEGTEPDNYTIETHFGKLTVLNRGEENTERFELRVVANGDTVTYDGKQHDASGILAVYYDDTPFQLSYDGKYHVTIGKATFTVSGLGATGASETNAGTYTNKVTGWDTAVVIDSNNNVVTPQFKITPVDGTLTINPAELTVVTQGAEKEYDGTALTNDADATITGFVNGETAGLTVIGSQTDPGRSDNTYSISWANPDDPENVYTANKGNYKIVEHLGTLEVTTGTSNSLGQKLVVNDYDAAYDGASHTISVDKSDLPSGTTVSYSLVDPKSADFSDSNWLTDPPTYTDFTDGAQTIYVRAIHPNYDTYDTFATVNISQKVVTINVPGDHKPYDGTPLVGTGSIDGIVDGETYFFEVTGAQLLVGSTPNTYTLKWAGDGTDADGNPYTAKKSNYRIDEKQGNLEVTSRDNDADKIQVEFGTAYDTIPYDGKFHSLSGFVNYTIGGSDLILDLEPQDNGAYGFTYNGQSYTVSGISASTTGEFINVSSYPLIVSGKDNITITDASGNKVTDQFAVTYAENALSIEQAKVTVIPKDDSKTYGEDDPELTAVVTGMPEGGSQVPYTLERVAGENVGEYTIAVIDHTTASSNYKIVETGTATFTIKPASADDLGLAVSGYEGTYDGTAHGITVNTDNLPEGTKLSYSLVDPKSDEFVESDWASEAPTFKDASDSVRTVYVRAENPNYETAYGSATASISKRAVTVVAEDASKVYGAAEPELKAAATGDLESEPLIYSVTREDGEAAGEYAISVSYTENPNYSVTTTGATFTITNASASALGLSAEDYSDRYDSESHGINVSTTLEGVTLSYSTVDPRSEDFDEADWSDTAPAWKDFDGETHTVYVKAELANYDTAYDSATVTISQLPVAVTAVGVSKSYDNNPTTDPALTATVTGDLNSEPLVYTLSREPGQDAGDYLISIAYTENPNYDVTATGATFTITPAGADALSLSVTGYAAPYDGMAHGVTVNTAALPAGTRVFYSTDNPQSEGFDESSWSETAPLITNAADSKTIYVKAENPNFGTAYGSAEVAISKRTVTVVADAKSKVYGADEPELTAEVTGDLTAEPLAYTLSREPGQDAGTYAISVAYAENPNFDVTTTGATFTITKGSADALGLDANVTGWSGSYDGTPHGVTVDTAALPAGTTVSYSTDGGTTWSPEAPTFTNVGDSTTVYVRAENPNYEPATRSVDVTINPVDVTIAADAKSKTYDANAATDRELTASVDGVIEGETLDYTLSREQGQDAGEYGISVTLGSNPNYNVTSVTGSTFTIDKRQVSLSTGNYGKTYDGTPITNGDHGVLASNFVPGEGVVPTFTGSQTLPGSSDNSFTYVAAEGTNLDNYEITKTEGTLSIAGRSEGDGLPITVRPNAATSTYDGTEHAVSGFETLTFQVNGKPFTVSGISASASGTDAGTYPVVVAGTPVVTDENGNNVTTQFAVTVADATLVIEQKPVTVTAADASKTYGEDDPELTAVVEGTLNGDAIAYTLSRAAGEAAGSYAITPAGEASQGNYAVSYVPATLTIGAKSIVPPADGTDERGGVQIRVEEPEGGAIYDGTAQTPTVVVTDGEHELVLGEDYTLAYTDNVDAGTATATVTGIGNYAGTLAQTFTISPRTVVLTSADAERVFNGEPLTATSVTVSGDGWATGEGATYDVTGSQTVAGSSANAFTYTLNAGTKAANYTISTVLGTLTVSEAPAEEPVAPVVPATTDDSPAAPTTPAAPADGAAAAPVAAPAGDAGAAAATPVADDAVAPTDTIADDANPLAGETIADDANPLAGGLDSSNGSWAVLNLICTVLTTFTGLAMIVAFLRRRREEDEQAARQADAEERQANKAKLLGLIPALASIVVFALTEDLAQQMAIADQWTALMVAILAVGLVGAYATRDRKADEDVPTTPAAA